MTMAFLPDHRAAAVSVEARDAVPLVDAIQGRISATIPVTNPVPNEVRVVDGIACAARPAQPAR